MRPARPGREPRGSSRRSVRSRARPEALGRGGRSRGWGCREDGAPAGLTEPADSGFVLAAPDPLCLFLGVWGPPERLQVGVLVSCSHLVPEVGTRCRGRSDRLQRSTLGPHAGPEGFSLAPGSVGWVCLELGYSPGIWRVFLPQALIRFPACPLGTPGEVMEIAPPPRL